MTCRKRLKALAKDEEQVSPTQDDLNVAEQIGNLTLVSLCEKRRSTECLTTHNIDRGQTREIGEKQEKYFKGKAVTFAVQRLIFFEYPVDLLTFFELNFKLSN